MRRLARYLLGLALAALLAAAALLGGRLWLLERMHRPHGFPAPRTVTIAKGESARSILSRLESAGVVASARWTRLYLVRELGDPPLLAGEYRFEPPLSADQVLEKLRRGEVVTYPVTVVEGLTFAETAEALAAAGLGSRERFLAEFADPRRVRDLDREAANLEGYLFPDTYRFRRGTSEAEVTDALVAEFRRHWERDVRPRIASGDATTPRALLILASLVEKEARLDAERPLVAAVYANRLRRGMGLYADPTIIYGLKLAGRWDGNLRRRDLEQDSPWNTYRILGLPPGPICSPGLASLAAAARPAAVDYLYFVSRNDGTHVFSASLAEHNRNVDIWQRQYFRRRRARGRAGLRD
ncbi:MAG: endolytic transglycosylase MltG [Thermoanaerobaculia bacterium]